MHLSLASFILWTSSFAECPCLAVVNQQWVFELFEDFFFKHIGIFLSLNISIMLGLCDGGRTGMGSGVGW